MNNLSAKETRAKKFIVLCLSVSALVFVIASGSFAQQRSISGKLAPTVEAGGWVIVKGSRKYLLLNADKFKNESWFKKGAQVAATGEIKRDVVTIYQEGVPFEARTLTPLRNSGTTGNADSRSTTVTGNARLERPRYG